MQLPLSLHQRVVVDCKRTVVRLVLGAKVDVYSYIFCINLLISAFI